MNLERLLVCANLNHTSTPSLVPCSLSEKYFEGKRVEEDHKTQRHVELLDALVDVRALSCQISVSLVSQQPMMGIIA